MDAIAILLLLGPLSSGQIDVPQLFPEAQIVESTEHVIDAIKNSKSNDEPELEVLHFLGRARAYGFHEWNFVIRASERAYAQSMLDTFVGRINSSELVRAAEDCGMGSFKCSLISDEVSNTDLHKFIKEVGGNTAGHRQLVVLDGLAVIPS